MGVLVAVMIAALAHGIPPTRADTARPLALPFATPPGPSTWMFEQFFGNTMDAYNFGKYWYAAGQGLHFGLDFEARCGTSVTAVADGVIEQIDNGLFGAGPHNLVIRHDALALVSVYGHLRDRVRLMRGQPVQRGQVVGVVGDPDLTCDSRPHLHLEIRSLDYRIAYNPVPLMDADWDMLYSIHQQEFGGFAKDLRRPDRWQSSDDQPLINFNNDPLNDFSQTWPPAYRFQPSPLTLPITKARPLADAPVTLRQLTRTGCCTRPEWSPDSRAIAYLDLVPDRDLANVHQIAIGGNEPGVPEVLDEAPPAILSPDGRYEVRNLRGTMTLIEREGGRRLPLLTRGAYPRFSPGSTRLLWHVRPGDDIPGEIAPRTEIWVLELATGEGTLVRVQSGGSVRWLDDERLLLTEFPEQSQTIRLSILTLRTGEVQPLLTTRFLRTLSVAPGGQHLMYALILQAQPAQNGVYLLETRPGARPQKLPFFGGWRWRDSHSVFYIPFDEPAMSLVAFDIRTRRQQPIRIPKFSGFQIASADWSLSPDGAHVLYLSAYDRAIWLLTLPTLDWF
jgi:murein DD-endopeptidase MepM/ murein hydrolase activator NlpD